MIDNIKFNYLIECIVDKPFALNNICVGWDCTNSILFIYRSLGYEFPEEMDGWTEENYSSKWNENSVEAEKFLGKFLHSLGVEVEKKFYNKGDLLIFTGKEIHDFPGIYLGNGNVLMVFDKGARVVPYRFFENLHTETRRLIE